MPLCSEVCGFLKLNKKLFIILLVPLLASMLPVLVEHKASKCAFVVIIMSVYWVTEAMPLAVTSLIPILLFPLLGIMPADKVSPLYFKDIVIITFGGIIVAMAIEITKLHERIALTVLLKFGTNPKWLMFGFMLITAFLSLWINNAAATAMMLPVVDAVVDQLIKNENEYHERITKANEDEGNEVLQLNGARLELRVDDSHHENGRRLATGFLLATAYAASIGGMGSLVGTPPNILTKGYFDKYHPEAQLDFLSFLLVSLPISILMLIVSWVWLVFRWLPRKELYSCRTADDHKIAKSNALTQILTEKYENLGLISWAEKIVGIIFVFLIVGWLTRTLYVVPGWGSLFLPRYVTDSIPAIIAVFLLFILPRENIFAGKPYRHLLDWDSLQKAYPWDVILLLGGSLAMADGFQESGLSAWVGSQLKHFSSSPKQIVLIVIQIITATCTQFTSNLAIASIFLPIIDSLAFETGLNQTYLILPMTLSVSLAFCLPFSSPNNAIIFKSGRIRILDMLSTGVVVNIIGILIVFLASNTWLGLAFDLEFHKKTIVNSTMITQS